MNPMNETSAATPNLPPWAMPDWHPPYTTMNPYLDGTLRMDRGPAGVTLTPVLPLASSPDGFLHFSIPTTIGEEAAWWALGEEHAVPLKVDVNLLSPARVGNGPVTAIGRAIRRGKTIMVAEATVQQNGKDIAHVVATFTRFEKREEPVDQTSVFNAPGSTSAVFTEV